MQPFTAVETPKMPLDVEQFWMGLSKRAGQIMDHWNDLQNIDLGVFRSIWTNLTPEVRGRWLKKRAAKLPEFPCAGIYAHLEGLEGRKASQDDFLFSSLNNRA
ncbi:hypothetical protein ColLi_13878 [Colletotrichum liriopes]|uniref:Uncharacterized protein n=1 Tax=Colletotrichum liriopes TaxID=708192 RepID=A0AA37H132_9PEZI|nr:hypothetical protein ColLi_13878 [Colletotrichum liriopes]